MVAVRLRLSIAPWTDRAFVRTVEDICSRLTASPEVDIASIAGAVTAERLLRDRGWPRARVMDRRTIDDALGHVGHWSVFRDGFDA